MTDAPDQLRPASGEEVAAALTYALRFKDGKRVRSADELMAQITADRLIEHLRLSGFVVMKTPPLEGHGQR